MVIKLQHFARMLNSGRFDGKSEFNLTFGEDTRLQK